MASPPVREFHPSNRERLSLAPWFLNPEKLPTSRVRTPSHLQPVVIRPGQESDHD
jgi:hypothetical protein